MSLGTSFAKYSFSQVLKIDNPFDEEKYTFETLEWSYHLFKALKTYLCPRKTFKFDSLTFLVRFAQKHPLESSQSKPKIEQVAGSSLKSSQFLSSILAIIKASS